MKNFRIVLFLLLAVSGHVFMMAQNAFATISGNVVDETNVPVIGATIKMKNESTGFTTATVTDINGHYSIPQLPSVVHVQLHANTLVIRIKYRKISN